MHDFIFRRNVGPLRQGEEAVEVRIVSKVGTFHGAGRNKWSALRDLAGKLVKDTPREGLFHFCDHMSYGELQWLIRHELFHAEFHALVKQRASRLSEEDRIAGEHAYLHNMTDR